MRRWPGLEPGIDCDRLTTLLLEQTVKQAKCDSTGHRKRKQQEQARLILMLRLLVPSSSREFSLR